MASLVELLNEWEIQLLVVLSFVLQMFLFFAGGLRRHTGNMLLRFTMWLAYLGADFVAVYALGYLSRHDDATTGKYTLGGTHKLVFLWAPFLLIHLGGQDTVTAFAIEDNNLWLRHLLNLVVQVGLALYVFWKSTGLQNIKILLPGIFVFIAGIIKYGERTLALMYGDLKNIGSSINIEKEEKLPQTNRRTDYSSIICFTLNSARAIRDILAGRSILIMSDEERHSLIVEDKLNEGQLPKLLEVELAMVYDDLYTKAKVLQTKLCIILRCISQVSMVVALVLFHGSSLQRYNRVDVAITYSLFIGGILLDSCGMFVMIMLSPWNWAWLEVREYYRLAGIFWSVLSSGIGWSEKRPLWSNSMGQYNLSGYLGYYSGQSRLSQRLMIILRKMGSMVGIRREKFFWLSKLLDAEYVPMDDKIIKGLLHSLPFKTQDWPNLRAVLKELVEPMLPLGHQIVALHIFTEAHLCKYPPPHPPSDMEANVVNAPEEVPPPHSNSPHGASEMDMNAASVDDLEEEPPPHPPMDMETSAASVNVLVEEPPPHPPSDTETNAASAHVLVEECRKLSSYMLYLVASQSSMLLVTSSSLPDTLQSFIGQGFLTENDLKDIAQGRHGQYEIFHNPPVCKETLEEIKEMWVRLLLYTAGKSRPEAHAAQLARGGELLTLAWLFMAHKTAEAAGETIEIRDLFPVGMSLDQIRRIS